MIGTTIAQYHILEKLGEGGMGVVYKARDTKLERDVALKFLPDRPGTSDQEKTRFVQEARAASSLNHPNVCTIHDIQEHAGPDGSKQMFIVMEFVDGQTLRDRMGSTGSMSLRQAVEIGIQAADGLSAAHDKGIVHRDIKPENIMIRKDGIAQIMDFGLAKLRASSSKITRLTREGSTVGTAGYMSPEQVQGLDSDHRSDIFSLGVLLYELFTGQLPFKGVHETALAYEIVNVDPAPMSVMKPDIDPSLDAIVLECMEKDPNERTQSAKQVAVDLRRYKRESSRQKASRITAARPVYTGAGSVSGVTSGAASGVASRASAASTGAMPVGGDSGEFSGEYTGAAAQPAAGRSRSIVPWIVAGLFFLTTAGALLFHFTNPPVPPPRRVTRATIMAPLNANFNVGNGGHIAISPDGRIVAFAASDTTGRNSLWVRPVGSMTPILLPGTNGATYPFWSPDNRTVAFFAGGKLKKIDAAGGPTLTICDAADGRGGTWNREGVIVFSPEANGLLSKVSAAGGLPVPLSKVDSGVVAINHRWPHFLPDGRHFVYTTQSTVGGIVDDSIRIASIDGGYDTVLMIGNSNVEYASGHLLFHRQSMLMAQPFDTVRLAFTGDAVPIAEELQYSNFRYRAIFSVSGEGVLIYQGGAEQTGRIAILDGAGNTVQVLDFKNPAGGRFSSDGKRIVLESRDDQARTADIWIRDIESGRDSRFTFDAAIDRTPVWSPGDDSIVFSSTRSKRYDLYVKHTNGTDAEQLLLQSDQDKFVSDWSRDGRTLAFYTTGSMTTKMDLWILPLTGDRKPIPFLRTEFREGLGSFSPDGRWIAYMSDETVRWEIYVRALDGSAGKWQISIDGGVAPRWAGDGKTIYFGSADRKAMAAAVRVVNSAVVVDSIRTLFDYDSRSIIGGYSDITPDGRRVLARIGESRLTTPPITMVVNWNEELKKQANAEAPDGR
ncbi:MAG TPA: protein kinase [Bacteroidota bacterium]|nr:protein kinase [Bacteroidota bacterium]